MGNLTKYLKVNGETVTSFAERVGIPRSSLSQMIHGHRTPTLEQAVSIHFATCGAVRCEDWILTPSTKQNGAT